MFTLHSSVWTFWLAFFCWYCVTLMEGGKTDKSVDFIQNMPSTYKGRFCMDGIKNQDESDIDCGGNMCPRCEDTKICNVNCDCISGICTDNQCVPRNLCKDKIKNQDETDIDCGGNMCPRCADSKRCNKNCDCISGVCKDNICTGGCPVGFSGPNCEIHSEGLCSNDMLSNSDPILSITFGRGFDQYSKKTPKDLGFTTTYEQQFKPVTSDGHFSLVNSIHDDFGGSWHTGAKDHTGDKGGYMFLVNADYTAGQFYNGTVNNLCVGQIYELSVYLANICKPNTVQIKPNVLFQVRTTVGNQLIAQFNSGDVKEYDTLTWEKFGISFKAPSSSVVLLMISNAPGGSGNDLALDDIALRVCSKHGTGLCPSKQ